MPAKISQLYEMLKASNRLICVYRGFKDRYK